MDLFEELGKPPANFLSSLVLSPAYPSSQLQGL